MFRLVHTPIDREAVTHVLELPQNGATVIFEGIVRNHARGKEVSYLEYEAYEPMALKEIRRIGEKAVERWPIHQVAIVHRLGRLEIGECSVLIVVTSAHRQVAFEACQFAINTLKQAVPIWKKEHYTDGELWIEGAA